MHWKLLNLIRNISQFFVWQIYSKDQGWFNIVDRIKNIDALTGNPLKKASGYAEPFHAQTGKKNRKKAILCDWWWFTIHTLVKSPYIFDKMPTHYKRQAHWYIMDVPMILEMLTWLKLEKKIVTIYDVKSNAWTSWLGLCSWLPKF